MQQVTLLNRLFAGRIVDGSRRRVHEAAVGQRCEGHGVVGERVAVVLVERVGVHNLRVDGVGLRQSLRGCLAGCVNDGELAAALAVNADDTPGVVGGVVADCLDGGGAEVCVGVGAGGDELTFSGYGVQLGLVGLAVDDEHAVAVSIHRENALVGLQYAGVGHLQVGAGQHGVGGVAAEARGCHVHDVVLAQTCGVLGQVHARTGVVGLSDAVGALGGVSCATVVGDAQRVEAGAFVVEVGEGVVTVGGQVRGDAADADHTVLLALLGGAGAQGRHLDFHGALELAGGVVFGAHGHVEGTGAVGKVQFHAGVGEGEVQGATSFGVLTFGAVAGEPEAAGSLQGDLLAVFRDGGGGRGEGELLCSCVPGCAVGHFAGHTVVGQEGGAHAPAEGRACSCLVACSDVLCGNVLGSDINVLGENGCQGQGDSASDSEGAGSLGEAGARCENLHWCVSILSTLLGQAYYIDSVSISQHQVPRNRFVTNHPTAHRQGNTPSTGNRGRYSPTPYATNPSSRYACVTCPEHQESGHRPGSPKSAEEANSYPCCG